MLHVGLTGGIGSGKSTVAAQLAGLGAVLIDSDGLAREVLAPGTAGLRAVISRFGAEILGDDGALDRAALATQVFADPQARADLEAITHPRIATRTAQLVAQADAAQAEVVVHEVPLLVEKAMQADYHLVVVAHADAAERLRRIVASRDTTAQAARERIDSQATDEQRRAVADVWLDTCNSQEHTRVEVDRLWRSRLQPFAANLRAHRPAAWPADMSSRAPDPTWPQQARRLIERLRAALGPGDDVQHVGPTSELAPAPDVLELRVTVDGDLATAAIKLSRAGFFADHAAMAQAPGGNQTSGAPRWHGRSADPGRPASVVATSRDQAAAPRTLDRRVDVGGT